MTRHWVLHGTIQTHPPGADQMVGLRFGNVQVPQGAKVISAHIEFVAKGARPQPI